MSDYPPVPEGWSVEKPTSGGWFTTAVTYLHPDGRRRRWSPRARRKGPARTATGEAVREGVLWAPQRAWWWMAVLFAVGSTCFLLGPIPAFLNLVGPQADAVVFFVGSVFFTVAALLQWLESVRTDMSAAAPGQAETAFWNPRRIDWWASSIQLIGTLFFNATTLRALTTAVGSPSYDKVVWRPDAFGSVCFLVSGLLAYAEVAGRLTRRLPRTMEGFVVGVNLLGCVLFALSAVGAYVLPATNSAVNVTIANVTTSLGALAFLIGSLLLFPERAEAQKTVTSASPA